MEARFPTPPKRTGRHGTLNMTIIMASANDMGHVYADVIFHGLNGRVERRNLMVDTGALYTWIPTSLAESLGVAREVLRPFRIATGEVVHRWTGQVVVEILETRVTTIVVFGDEGTRGLLGVYTLEGLLLEVDTTNHVLKKAEAANACAVMARLESPAAASA